MSYESLDQKAVMLGSHEARLDSLEADVSEIKRDVKEILAFMQRSRGSWKTLLALGTAVATVVEIFHQLAGAFHGK